MQRITTTVARTNTSAGNENALRGQHGAGTTAAPAWPGGSHNPALARRPLPQAASGALQPQQPIGAMPPELLHKLHSHIPSPSDRIHFTLANTAALAATTPTTPDQALAHLQEAARGATDFKSFMVVFDQTRQQPEAPRAELFRELAGRVGDVAQWATSSQAHIQAAAPQAERSFRQLWRGIAELPTSMQVEPLLVLGRQLRALPVASRLAAMEAVLGATRPAAANPQRVQLLEHIARQLGLFLPQELGRAVGHVLGEAAALAEAQRRSVCDALRSGVTGARLPSDQHAALQGAIDKVSPSAPVARPSGRDLLGLRRPAR